MSPSTVTAYCISLGRVGLSYGMPFNVVTGAESWGGYAFRARAVLQKQLYMTLHPCTAQHHAMFLLRVEVVIGISFRISNRIGTSIGVTASNIGAGIRIGI